MVGVVEEVETTKPTGRPSGYQQAVADEVCARVLAGETLNEIAEAPGMPPVSTLYGWFKQVPSFKEEYSRARADSGQASEGRIRSFMRQVATGEMDANAGRVLINAEQWLAAKRAPRTHGDRVEVEHSGTVQGGLGPVTIQILAHAPAAPAVQVIDCQAEKTALPDK